MKVVKIEAFQLRKVKNANVDSVPTKQIFKEFNIPNRVKFDAKKAVHSAVNFIGAVITAGAGASKNNAVLKPTGELFIKVTVNGKELMNSTEIGVKYGYITKLKMREFHLMRGDLIAALQIAAAAAAAELDANSQETEAEMAAAAAAELRDAERKEKAAAAAAARKEAAKVNKVQAN
jgi:hypothetical protein